MTKVTFIEHDGAEHIVDAADGVSLMEAAVRNNVPGIDADCGGACSCATCHVYVDEAWGEQAGTPSDNEAAMLEFAENTSPASRLSCQIRVSAALEGLIVRLPESQH